MNLPQALVIIKDHIRIGKGMELINGVPEALEMVVLAGEHLRKENERLRAVLEHISKTEFCRYEEQIKMAQFRDGFAFDLDKFKNQNPICKCPKCMADEALKEGD